MNLSFFGKKFSERDQKVRKLIQDYFYYSPKNFSHYLDALRHKSAVILNKEANCDSNERLELLGDAILDAIVIHFLYEKYPSEKEGILTKLKSKIVSRKHLNHLAKKMGIHEVIEKNLSAADESDTLYGNALEALIGAMYLDIGFSETRKKVIGFLNKNVDVEKLREVEEDFKSLLYQWAQKYRNNINFKTTEKKKPSGMEYKVDLWVNGVCEAHGAGTSKKRAEQMASKSFMTRVVNG